MARAERDAMQQSNRVRIGTGEGGQMWVIIFRFCFQVFHPCAHANPFLLSFVWFSLRAEDRGCGLIAQGRQSEGKFWLLLVVCFYSHLFLKSLIPYYHHGGEEAGVQIWEKGDRCWSRNKTMGGVLRQDGAKGVVCFHDFIFKSVQTLICYCFFSFSWSYLRPRWCGRPYIEIDTNIWEEKRE